MANGLKVKPYYWLTYVEETLTPKAEQHRRNYWKHGLYDLCYLISGGLAFWGALTQGMNIYGLGAFICNIALLSASAYQHKQYKDHKSAWNNLQPVLKLTQSEPGHKLLRDGEKLREEWLSIERIRAAQEDIAHLYDKDWRKLMGLPTDLPDVYMGIPKQIKGENNKAAQRVIQMADALHREQRELLNVILGDNKKHNPFNTDPNTKPPDWHTNLDSVLVPLTGT